MCLLNCFVFFRRMTPMKKASGQSDVMYELDVLPVCVEIDRIQLNNKVKFHSPSVTRHRADDMGLFCLRNRQLTPYAAPVSARFSQVTHSGLLTGCFSSILS